MTEIFNGLIYTFGTYSALKAVVSYDKKRVGADMQYRFNYKIFISDRSGNPYAYGNYNNKLKAEFTLNGVKVWEKETSSTSTGWSFEYTSDWFTVKNKTTGTTPFKFTIKDTQNSSWCNYTSSTYSLGVDPAGSDIGAVANFNIGNAITVPITKYASMYDVLVVKIGSTFIKTINNASNLETITFTSSELNTIYGLTTEVQSTVFTFELTTYEDSSKATIVGTTKSTTARGYIVGSAPSINSITFEDTNSTTKALTGDSSKMVRYKSNVKVSVSASGVNSATITSVTINDKTATLSNGYYVATFNSASTNNFKVVVVDSRGFDTPDTKTMPMVSYIPLTLSASVRRNQPTDGKVVIDYSGNYFDGSFGSENNTLTVQYRYIEKGGTWKDVWNTLTPTISGNTYNGNAIIEDFDYQKQFVFQVKVADKLSMPKATEVSIAKGEAILYWKENLAGVNGDFVVKSGKSIKSGKYLSTDDLIKFQTNIFGANSDGFKFKAIRSSITNNTDYPHDSSGMAWAGRDTHGFIITKYGSADVVVGGGNANAIKWVKHLAFKDDLSSYQLKETVLYNNTTGTTGSITLSESSANFTYLEFFYYRTVEKKLYGSTKVYSPNGKVACLTLSGYWKDSAVLQVCAKNVLISGTNVTVQTSTGFGNIGSSPIASSEDEIYITRIVGYK